MRCRFWLVLSSHDKTRLIPALICPRHEHRAKRTQRSRPQEHTMAKTQHLCSRSRVRSYSTEVHHFLCELNSCAALVDVPKSWAWKQKEIIGGDTGERQSAHNVAYYSGNESNTANTPPAFGPQEPSANISAFCALMIERRMKRVSRRGVKVEENYGYRRYR